jgi:hypothetical protein
MTDPLSLRAMAERLRAANILREPLTPLCHEAADAIEAAQSSWANEKAEMERQLDGAAAAYAMMRWMWCNEAWPGAEIQQAAVEWCASHPLAAKGE